MARHSAHRATRFVAQLVEGDAYVEQHGIAAIDFMKIDVEGAEHLVLKGLRRTMEDWPDPLHPVRVPERFRFRPGCFWPTTTRCFRRSSGSGRCFQRVFEFRDYEWTMESFRFSNFLCVSRRRPDLKELAEANRVDAEGHAHERSSARRCNLVTDLVRRFVRAQALRRRSRRVVSGFLIRHFCLPIFPLISFLDGRTRHVDGGVSFSDIIAIR